MSGIYLHIPFCKQACNYCNFHFATSLRLKDELVAALVKEIAITSSFTNNTTSPELIQSVYFGGGTPSILEIKDLQLIFEALQSRFNIADTAEITLEANPDDIDDDKLMEWKKLGINRLSLGIQSFLEKELAWMNRAHTAEESLRCIDAITVAGFTNFSIDLIYGSPLLTNEDWLANLALVIEKKIPHISCYALTVEPKTPLEKMIHQQKKAPVDAEKQSAQFILLMDTMQAAGYEHYEISNFSLPGRRSKHNSSYWQAKHYYGFGPSAHSFDGKSRKWNIANNNLYISSLQNNDIPFEEELLTPTQQLNEYIMTSLRTMEGLDLERISKEFGQKFSTQLATAGTKWADGNKLIRDGSKLILTQEGKLFADGIAADLFF